MKALAATVAVATALLGGTWAHGRDAARLTVAVSPIAVVQAAPAPPPPPEPAGPPAATPPLTGPFTVATVVGGSIGVYSAPGAAAPARTLPSPGIVGAPQVFLVTHQVDPNWLEVELPTRPNGSTGFIRTSDVTLTTHDVQVKVELGLHRLTAWSGDHIIEQDPVIVGAPSMPTPAGSYYLQGFVATGNPRGAYGPYIFALSSHSNVFQYFAGGDGLIGLHGTNEPNRLGQSVSHGCVRVDNAAITRLVSLLPPGTPIVIE